MMTHTTLYCTFVVALIAPALIQCISVVGPRVLRPFSSYSVAIAGGSRAHTLYVAVEGRRSNGEQFSQGRQVQVPPATSRQVDFDIGDPGPGEYSLVARSTSGPLFSSAAPLVYQPRSFCVFVQTDKRVYQPRDTINFAVIALDKHLLPISNTVDVSVLDAGGSPVWQKLAVPLDKGIFTDQFMLADEPALGEWTIQVEARGQTYSRQILVADYVMPKFQMDIQLPKEVLFTEGRFTVNVTAKHFNGLPVNGELTISAYAVFFSQLLQPVFSPPSRKVLAFNGNAEIVYDLKTDLDLAVDAARPLVVEAVLEEYDTLIRQNVSSRILLMRTPYRLKVTAPDYVKPTLPYNVQIEVVDSSGQMLDVNEDVTVERLWDDGAPVNVTTLKLKNGFVTYTLVPDMAHINSTLNLVIKYKDVVERVVNVQRNSDSSGQFLTVELLTRGTSVGDEMRARITATEPMDLVHYVVIGRGDILVAKTLELNPARRSVDISVEVSRAMTPGCVVLAWYPRLDSTNTMLAAALYAPQQQLLHHHVSLKSVSASNYQPNTLTELQVTGEAGARAVVLGADVNAVAAGLSAANGLGSGLDMHTIQREVESFSGLKHSVFKNEEHLPGLGLDIAGYTSLDVFKKVGFVILTDGVIVQNGVGVDPKHEEPETGTRPPLAGPYAFSRLPPPPSPRYFLTVSPLPTWAFSNFSLDNIGRGSAERWTPPPHVPVKLKLGAFAVDSKMGLGLATPQDIATSVPLSINVELPNTMQRGESVAAVVVLKSTLTADITVEVTMYNTGQKFEFEPLDNDINSKKKIEPFGRLHVTVPAEGSASSAFLVTVVQTGSVEVLIDAKAPGVSASFSKTIEVTDGYQEDVWVWNLLNARSGVARANMTLEPIAGTRLGPARLMATGDLLSSALQALWQSPPAAGDPPHAVRPLAVACVLLDYLQTTNQEKEAWNKAARDLASLGFQRLMAYRRSDGSFAPETDRDAKGDVWMTAISTRWLSRCARYVEVTPLAVTAASEWLARMQKDDGSWEPPTLKTDPRAQAPLPLTAHVLLALSQAKGKDIHYKNALNKAVDYLAKGLTPFLDAYALAVVGNALAVAKHPEASVALQYMDKYVNNTGSTLFWSRKLSGSEWRNPWLKSNSLEASTAAWGLRTMLASRLEDKAEPVARFLLQAYKPNDPDPDVLDAIAHYAELIKTTTKLRISVNVTGSQEPKLFQIGDNNPLIIQDQAIFDARSATAVTEGRGIALVGLSAKGNTNVTGAWPRYTLDPRVDMVSTKYRMQLSICLGYVPQGNETESGLTLLTVQLPTGYLADINTITELTAARMVVSARVQAGGSRVLAWVRPRRAEQCATLAAPRALPVARQRPAWATLQDLYDSSHRARVFYQAPASSACDVCREWESCARACGSAGAQLGPAPAPASRTPRPAPGAAADLQLSVAALALALAIVALR
ncbi:CD109 antigen-like [Ostrinia furnacalis]|uniref:CD109 antigen-like n=1 Tax=Ostrinia furnacalis TaxID=93504 RepID=UPI00103BEF35|nr:CD109 antigen-like [Ostrinia furnacalis]